MKDYPLNEDHKFTGDWWLPGLSEKYHGVLTFDNNKSVLEIHGSFQEKNNGNVAYNRFVGYSYILGECNGKYFTLIHNECDGVSLAGGSSISIKERLKTSYIIVNENVVDGSITNLVFRVPSLQAFMDELIIKSEIKSDPKPNIKYVITNPSKKSFKLNAISSIVEIGYYWKQSGDKYKNLKIESGAYFSIKPNSKKSIDWFLKERKKITMWLTFLSGYGMSPDMILGSKTNEPPDFHALIALPDQNLCNINNPFDFFIIKNNLEQSLDVCLNNWFDVFDKFPNFKNPCALSFEILSTPIKKVDFVNFLNLTAALEGVHRAMYEGNYMDENNYKCEVHSVIVNSIPEGVGRDHRAALKSRIKFGNQISLRKRFKELADEFDDAIKEKLFGKSKIVPQSWIDTRNYFTHWDEESKQNVLSDKDLYHAIIRLRGFLRITLLIIMGISQNTIIEALKNNSNVSLELKHLMEFE